MILVRVQAFPPKMNKKEIQHWFDKGIAIGYHASLNDEQLSWLKPRNKLFEKLFELRYPDKVCEHEWYENSNGGAQCMLCESYSPMSTWYCRKSPDHLCHYDNGNYDSCDYCGHPQERK